MGSEGGGEGRSEKEHLMGKVGRERRRRREGSVKVDGKTVPFTCTLVHRGSTAVSLLEPSRTTSVQRMQGVCRSLRHEFGVV